MTSNTKQATGAEMRLAARQARLARLIENMVYGDKVRDQVAAPDETAALAAVDSATLAAVQRCAVSACSRVSSVLADSDDVASDAIVRLARGTASDRVALATVASGSASALTVVRRMVRSVAQDAARSALGLGHHGRSVTGDDVVSYRCIADGRDAVAAAQVNGPTSEQVIARMAALAADGPAVTPDRDGTRRYVGGRAATVASLATHGVAFPAGDPDAAVRAARGAAVRSVGKVREVTTGGPLWNAKGAVRIIREQDLETLLSSDMRNRAHVLAQPSPSGRTLASILGPDGVGAAWSAAWSAHVDHFATDAASPPTLRRAVAGLAKMTAGDWHATASHYFAVSAAATSAATVARLAVPAAGGPVDRRTARKTALAAAKVADTVAARAASLSALAVGAWSHNRDHGPVTLSTLIALSLSATVADTHQAVTVRRPDVSTWDRAAVLAILGLPVDSNGRVARSLTAITRDAATMALDADGVTGPVPADVALATRRMVVARTGRSVAARNLARHEAGIARRSVAARTTRTALTAWPSDMATATSDAYTAASVIGRLVGTGR